MAKRHVDPVQGSRVRLRLLEERDLPMTLAWRNRDHIRRWFVDSRVISPERHRAWFERYRERDDDFVFVIEMVREPTTPVGQVALYNIDWERKRAEYGRLLIGEPEARGRGLAKEATSLVLEVGSEQLGMEEYVLEVFKENHPACAIYAAVGFVAVGERGDLLVMRLTRGGAASV